MDEPCLNHCKIANIQTPNTVSKSKWECRARKSLQECSERPDMLVVRITDSHSHLWVIERREQWEWLHSLEQMPQTRRQISAVCLGLACAGMLIKNSSPSWPGVMPLLDRLFKLYSSGCLPMSYSRQRL